MKKYIAIVIIAIVGIGGGYANYQRHQFLTNPVTGQQLTAQQVEQLKKLDNPKEIQEIKDLQAKAQKAIDAENQFARGSK